MISQNAYCEAVCIPGDMYKLLSDAAAFHLVYYFYSIYTTVVEVEGLLFRCPFYTALDNFLVNCITEQACH